MCLISQTCSLLVDRRSEASGKRAYANRDVTRQPKLGMYKTALGRIFGLWQRETEAETEGPLYFFGTIMHAGNVEGSRTAPSENIHNVRQPRR